ncbi:MAG: ParB/RepB/Spo0J family partition protein [Oscillospiraceae bacterium]|nr:ParB/RepB/Spo0J family partition protein [Oscillospiraceae bacterium]
MEAWRGRFHAKGGRIVYLPVTSIRPNPAQPRTQFDSEALRELAQSIRCFGVLQPLSVRRTEDGWELVAGERRLRAARMAGLGEVPCIVLRVDEQDSGLLALIENLQRQDLDYIEQAEGLARLMRQYGMSQEQAARRIGKSQSAVANKLRILKHPPEVLDALRETGLSERHARALLRLEAPQDRLRLLFRAARECWPVARLEQAVDAELTPKRRPLFQGVRLRDTRLLLNALEHSLKTARMAGLSARCRREETEREIVLTIRVPK